MTFDMNKHETNNMTQKLDDINSVARTKLGVYNGLSMLKTSTLLEQ